MPKGVVWSCFLEWVEHAAAVKHTAPRVVHQQDVTSEAILQNVPQYNLQDLQALREGQVLHGRGRGGNLDIAMAVATALAAAGAGEEVEGDCRPWVTLHIQVSSFSIHCAIAMQTTKLHELQEL